MIKLTKLETRKLPIYLLCHQVLTINCSLPCVQLQFAQATDVTRFSLMISFQMLRQFFPLRESFVTLSALVLSGK